MNRHQDDQILFEKLPVSIGLDSRDPRDFVGWADAYRDRVTNITTIEIRLSPDAAEKLGDLTEVFRLYGLAFAGVRKEPNDVRSS